MRLRSRASYRARQASKGRAVKERRELPPESRYCPDCDEIKPLAAFPRSKSGRGGFGGYCKPCHNVRNRSSKELNGGPRNYHLRRRYGISGAEVDLMLEQQGGLCAICHAAAAVHVDHDHVFGTVRGVLCFNCNGGLGQFRDRTDVMRNAIHYLERTTWQRTLVSPGVYQLTSPRPGAAASATS